MYRTDVDAFKVAIDLKSFRRGAVIGISSRALMKHLNAETLWKKVLDSFSFFGNKANLEHSSFLLYFFLVYLSISTCFGRLCAHRQEKQMYLCDTWCLLFCMDDWLVCSVE